MDAPYETSTADPCPECTAGKHGNCDSTSWDFDTDEGVFCPCWWNNGGEPGGPCYGPPRVGE